MISCHPFCLIILSESGYNFL